MNAATRATSDYNTYLYVLESLYNEYGNGASEPTTTKMMKEVSSEGKVSHNAPTPQPQPQERAGELAVVVKTVKDEKPQEKSRRFKFNFP